MLTFFILCSLLSETMILPSLLKLDVFESGLFTSSDINLYTIILLSYLQIPILRKIIVPTLQSRPSFFFFIGSLILLDYVQFLINRTQISQREHILVSLNSLTLCVLMILLEDSTDSEALSNNEIGYD